MDSSSRMSLWQRNFESSVYDFDKVGWPVESKAYEEYEAISTEERYSIYNTSLQGYSNQGHTFGDQLAEQDRKSLIEYLKSL